jgi:hypothetical protein
MMIYTYIHCRGNLKSHISTQITTVEADTNSHYWTGPAWPLKPFWTDGNESPEAPVIQSVSVFDEFISVITDLFLPSFPSALQLRVSFGLLNNVPPFLSIPRLTVWFLNNLVFMV